MLRLVAGSPANDVAVRLKEGADKALYQAKIAGRDQAIAASEALLPA